MSDDNLIHDLIQTTKVECSDETIDRLLNILTEMNSRINDLQADLERNELRAKRHTTV